MIQRRNDQETLYCCLWLASLCQSTGEYPERFRVWLATASFIGHEHLEPLDLWGKAAILQKMLFKGNHRGSKA